jgi:hypothetical protein
MTFRDKHVLSTYFSSIKSQNFFLKSSKLFKLALFGRRGYKGILQNGILKLTVLSERNKMAQFIAFDKNVEVNGRTILSVVNAMDFGRETRSDILKECGLDPEPDKWYNQQKWLNAFRTFYHMMGERTLFMIGKAIPQNAEFPPGIKNLNEALELIDVAYHLNHRGGEIGYYKLLSFNKLNRNAVMKCYNPYPSEFDRGIITTMLRDYKPKSFNSCQVLLDPSKETRMNGGESCTYLVSW